ncbi:MAG: TlpA disulfide reductase family protein [Gallionella sp.]|nr:TlpA disulfide reductase family protein [Gallionella sp.]
MSSNLLQSAILTAIFFILPILPVRAAALNDVAAVPHLDSAGKEGYRGFLAAGKQRAFAIGPGGAWAWKGSEAAAELAAEAALQFCQTGMGQTCVLYSVNDRVVFDALAWARLWGPYLNRSEAGRAHVGKERGERFYNLIFQTSSGKATKLSDLRGKVVVLHFWGSWCKSCRHEMPELQQLYRALGAKQDIRMVLLQVREDFAASRQWAQQQRLELPLYDSGVHDKTVDALPLADGLTVGDRDIAAAFPTTYILDKHGIVVFSHVGAVSGWLQYLPLLRDVSTRSGK